MLNSLPARLFAGALMASAFLSPSFSTPVHAADSAVVFMYHRFGEDRFPATSVRMDAFEAQLNWLAENNFEVIDLRQLLAFLSDGGELPERAVVLTIDDAYATIHSRAWPLLRERNWPFTIFVATEPVDDGYSDFLSWSQLREMAEAGVTIANHGAGHQHLATPRDGDTDASRTEWVRVDLLTGASRLEAELGDTGAVIDGVFAYPFGEYDTVVAAIVEDLGWIAFGQQSGAVGSLSDRRALPRFPINENHSALNGFGTKAFSRPLAVSRIEPWDPVTGPEPLLEVWLAPSAARLDQLACFVGGQGSVPVDWQEKGRQFRVAPTAPFRAGRQRVNCTAPGADGRFFWFSHQWLVRP